MLVVQSSQKKGLRLLRCERGLEFAREPAAMDLQHVPHERQLPEEMPQRPRDQRHQDDGVKPADKPEPGRNLGGARETAVVETELGRISRAHDREECKYPM